MRTDNTVLANNNADVYENNIFLYADEYVDSLRDDEEIYKQNSNQFTGLIKYVNRKVKFDRCILADINILHNIWECYTELVYKYNQKPTLEEYCILVGISRDTIYSWLNNECRVNDICEKLGTTRSDTIKKWQEECKLGRYKGAASGNVGMIFLCKAVDGMVETAPMQVAPKQSALSAAELPRLGTANTAAKSEIVAEIDTISD